MKRIILALVGLLAVVPSVALALGCNDLDGAEVWSQEPTQIYLGFFGSQFAADSIGNSFGTYGSQFSALSVHNTFGSYGSPFSIYSANNPYTTTPPVIFMGNTAIALLTANPYLNGGVSLDVIESSCIFYASAPGGGQAPPPVNLDQHGVTGTWYNPSASGQGIVMEVNPDQPGNGRGTLFGGWFTYDVSAAGGKRWYSLQATVDAANPTSTFSIYETNGGAFNSLQPVQTTSIGQAQLMMLDCSTALLGYAFADGSGRSGVIPLTRLLANVTCGVNGDNGHAMGAYALSGSWADPSGRGQGLVIEVNPIQGQLFAGWFTYAVNANSNAGPSAQRWYSLQAGIGSSLASPLNVGIYESNGGAFNAASQITTAPVGSAQLQFLSCSEATLSYSFTSGSNAGQSGTLHLGRVVPASVGCALQ